MGTICDFRNMYQTKPDEDGVRSWTRDLPSDLPEPAEDADSAQYALLVRKEKCYDGRKSLSVHSIVVQSDHLKGFLGKVLDNYPGVTTTLDRLEFTAPFKPFVHRWEEIVKFRDEEQDPITKSHVDLFYRIMDEELKDVIDCKKDLIVNGVITYPLAWTIMEPHDVVISSVGGLLRGHQFDNMTLTKCGWRLYADHVDFDGSQFGYNSETFMIPMFTGTVPITSLSVFPLKYHPEKDSIRKILAARGKRWEEHKGYHFKSYNGTAISRDYNEDDENLRDTKYHIKGRIIIDADAYNIFHPTGTISVSSIIDEDELNDAQRLIATPMVHGYSLKDKEWLIFYLDNSSEIEWDERAFESLVLPKEQQGLKEVILGVAKAQSKKLDSFDDVVQGKGRGIIMQLAGPPGVGKTLTAESVAEVMKVPLYVMSAGDLGMDASNVESNLKQILKAVPRWGAVLLLDEADVFMEARDATDLARNELVSIFLRMLEYYEVSIVLSPSFSVLLGMACTTFPSTRSRTNRKPSY